MGNATSIRSFALSGGAAGSLVGAVLVVLVVLGAILAFNGDDRSTGGAGEQSVTIQGAPGAAAQAVGPATRAVAGRPAPADRVEAASSLPSVFSGGPAGVLIEPPRRLPGASPAPLDPDTDDDGEPAPGPCVLGDVLPECIRGPDPPSPGGLIGGVAGGVDQAGNELLGVDLGLQALSGPLADSLDDPGGDLGRTTGKLGRELRSRLERTTGRLADRLSGTLAGVNGVVHGLTGSR